MTKKGLTELNVFRGTYKEIQAKETRDMTIYLAWDTQEIFIGNSLGTKVKYGGSRQVKTEVNKYLSEFKSEIYDEVKKYANNVVDSKLIQFEEEYNKKISELESKLTAKIEEDISNNIEEALLGVNEDISAIRNSLSALQGTVSENVESIANIESRVQTIEGSVSDNNNKISALQSSVGTLESNVNALEENKLSTEDFNTFKTEVNSNISTINANISEIDGKITSINNEIESIKAAINLLKNQKLLRFMTGDDLATEISSLSDISTFTPTFCTTDSTDETYTAGTFYYYDITSEEIVSVATGGSGSTTPEEIISNLLLTISDDDPTDGVDSSEINASDMSLTITAGYDKADAISGDLVLLVDGERQTLTSNSTSINLSRNTEKSHVITLTASAKENTKKYTYKVNSAGKTYSIYYPSFMGIETTNSSELLKLGKVYKKTWPTSFTSEYVSAHLGEVLYIYIPKGKTISNITMSGYPYDGYYLEGEKSLTVNGLDCIYNVYSLGTVYETLGDLVIS